MQRSQESVAQTSDSPYALVPHLPTVVYWGIHALCIAVLWTPPTAGLLVLLGLTFWTRMFFVTGGYHRYFSHKTYKTSRVFQFVIALFGTMAVQKGPLWWAGIHRLHHRYSDEPSQDPHTPLDGFWYSHAGWIQDPRWDPTPTDQVRDLARFPELRWLNRWHFAAPVALAVGLAVLGGWPAFLWGFAVSTVLLWHSTYTINSLAHRFGSRRFETPDSSRNNWMLALLTMGEGWHNNHHRYMASTRQGFLWWELDATYYVLRGLAALGLVWELREPPAELLHEDSLPEAA
jgi:stearoyl-CoA desaturase (delta-9 desaturase)